MAGSRKQGLEEREEINFLLSLNYTLVVLNSMMLSTTAGTVMNSVLPRKDGRIAMD